MKIKAILASMMALSIAIISPAILHVSAAEATTPQAFRTVTLGAPNFAQHNAAHSAYYADTGNVTLFADAEGYAVYNVSVGGAYTFEAKVNMTSGSLFGFTFGNASADKTTDGVWNGCRVIVEAARMYAATPNGEQLVANEYVAGSVVSLKLEVSDNKNYKVYVDGVEKLSGTTPDGFVTNGYIGLLAGWARVEFTDIKLTVPSGTATAAGVVALGDPTFAKQNITYSGYDVTAGKVNLFADAEGYAVYGVPADGAYTFEADAKMASGAFFGFTFGNPANDKTADTAWVGCRVVLDGIQVYAATPSAENATPYTYTAGNTVKLKFEALDSKNYKVYVNGVEVLSGTTPDGFVTNGYIGLLAGWANVEFTNVKLTKPAATFKEASLTLADQIGVNFKLDLSSVVVGNPSKASMVFTQENGHTATVELADAPKDGDLYVFSYDVAAKEMGDNINAKLMYDGSCLAEYDYSVKEYADYILADTASTQKSKDMAQALLTYGAAAQKRFNYNATELVTNVTAEAIPAGTLTGYTATKTGAVTGVTYQSTTAVLESYTALRQYFNVTGDVNGYTFKVNGAAATPVKASDGVYYVEVSGIVAQEMGVASTVAVTKDSETYTIECSVYTYINAVIAGNTASADVMTAAYRYCEAAIAYFA